MKRSGDVRLSHQNLQQSQQMFKFHRQACRGLADSLPKSFKDSASSDWLAAKLSRIVLDTRPINQKVELLCPQFSGIPGLDSPTPNHRVM
jgi:hypothetical protein